MFKKNQTKQNWLLMLLLAVMSVASHPGWRPKEAATTTAEPEESSGPGLLLA